LSFYSQITRGFELFSWLMNLSRLLVDSSNYPLSESFFRVRHR